MASDAFEIIRIAKLPAVECTCGSTRRAFIGQKEGTVSVHEVEIKHDARTHYHKRLTEMYYVLEGEGEIELDGQRYPVHAGDAVLIKPGCRHRAVGRLRIVNIPVPAFDESDEWFD